ncbi:MAG: DUF3782 domain-containing protein [Anaerolineae bacterium]
MSEMDIRQVKEFIMQELPGILQEDVEMQRFILRISSRHFADKAETESRFDRLLDELRRDREEQSKRWAEQNTRWDENQATINQMLRSIQDLARKHDTTIGALGARWGLHTEQSFRNALKGILEEFFDVQVINVVEYDDTGEVFGQPDQVELDLIIKDGLLIICEIKSSMSKGDMYIFGRKVKFYEQKHDRKATRMLVISPMVDERAQSVADKLGVQVYSHAQDVDPALFA